MDLDISDIRQQLLARSDVTYLGDKTALDDCQWVHFIRPGGTAGGIFKLSHNIPITDEDEDEWMEYEKAVADAKGKGEEVPDVPTKMKPVVMSMIVVISDKNFFLTSDGTWRKKSSATSFADVKPSGMGAQPNNKILEADFDTAWTTLTKTIKGRAAFDLKKLKGIIDFSEEKERLLRFRHPDLFQLRSSVDGNIPTAKWTIDHWPTTSIEGSEELDKIKETHFVNPIPAFDVNEELIAPENYRKELQGALVVMSFTLSVWRNNDAQSFYADIVAISVLEPPKIEVTTPRKRKVPDTNPFVLHRKRVKTD